MWWTKAIVVLAIAYFIGGIPFGYILVKLKTGHDVRRIQSGRTGTTNALRAAGVTVGVLTVVLDITKGYVAVWLARQMFPNQPWLHVLAGLLMIIGHNYPLVMVEHERGKPKIKGGAGGAPSVGGAMGLWLPIVLIQVPLGALLLLGVGYASVATMSMPVIAMIVFAARAARGLSPWAYVWYGALAEVLLLWALRPNIKRLMDGNERMVGLRAWLKKKRAEQQKRREKGNPPD